jgi:hypothetical protein
MLLCATAVSAQEAADTSAPLVPFDSALASALELILLTPDDIRLRTDYTEPDSFRLSLVDSVMRSPLSVFDVAADFESLVPDSGQVEIASVVEKTAQWLDVSRTDSPYEMGELLPDSLLSTEHIFRGLFGADADALDSLPVETRDFMASLLGPMLDAARFHADAFSALSDDETDSLRRRLPDLILEDPDAWKYSPEELDSLGKLAEELSEAILPILSRVDRMAIGAAMYGLSPALVRMSQDRDVLLPVEGESEPGEFQLAMETKHGGVYIGGTGRNVYPSDPFLVIDIGGDDLYSGRDSFRVDSVYTVSVILDLSGDDTYRGTDGVFGAGYFGVGVLWDVSGNDLYDVRHFGLGAGLVGFGLLVDESGDDIYDGDTFTQGAGLAGAGLLLDLGGRDRYSCALYGQGFSQSAGLGLVFDRDGDDAYIAGGRYFDILRYTDRSLSLSQGFSIGFRPDASGGVGAIVDRRGNDSYVADVFGQGTSYWWSLGMIVDGGGNDHYQAQQYAQGSGVHLAVGALLDRSGNDTYAANGVAQGCGHDLAFGILLDERGHDEYVAGGLAQGAGNANGIGLLCDLTGNDLYVTETPTNSQGYGNPRREYGSIGVFLDLRGEDRYLGRGCDGGVRAASRWGVGVDWSENWGTQ